jgi:hypothetical protein
LLRSADNQNTERRYPLTFAHHCDANHPTLDVDLFLDLDVDPKAGLGPSPRLSPGILEDAVEFFSRCEESEGLWYREFNRGLIPTDADYCFLNPTIRDRRKPGWAYYTADCPLPTDSILTPDL